MKHFFLSSILLLLLATAAAAASLALISLSDPALTTRNRLGIGAILVSKSGMSNPTTGIDLGRMRNA